MTETKWTKGPWDAHAGPPNLQGKGACACGSIISRDHPIAKVAKGDWGDTWPSIRPVGPSIGGQFEAFIDGCVYGHVPEDEALANARLIAAAPDLYEALHFAINHPLTHLSGDVEPVILAALAKARGERL